MQLNSRNEMWRQCSGKSGSETAATYHATAVQNKGKTHQGNLVIFNIQIPQKQAYECDIPNVYSFFLNMKYMAWIMSININCSKFGKCVKYMLSYVKMVKMVMAP